MHDQSKVYCMCEEYQWIYRFLEKNPQFKERCIGYYQFKKLPEEIFTDMEWDMIQELIHSPMDFYAHKYADGYKNKVKQLKQELTQIKSSKTWKAGSLLLYLPKNLKRMIKNE